MKSKSRLLNPLLIIVTIIVTLFMFELGLSILRFPTELSIQIAHPPNYHETRIHIEFQYDFKTNSQGLRYREIPLQKPDDVKRIFIIGDSFTEGYGVEAEDCYTSVLESIFSGNDHSTQFINGGLTGTGPIRYNPYVFDFPTRRFHIDLFFGSMYRDYLSGSSPANGGGSQLRLDSFSHSLPSFSLCTKEKSPSSRQKSWTNRCWPNSKVLFHMSKASSRYLQVS